jgi:hypothetical protein
MTRLPFEEDEVTRCRRMRDELDKRFKTLDEAFAHLAHLAKLRKQRATRTAKARGKTKAKSTLGSSSPAPRKAAHRA